MRFYSGYPISWQGSNKSCGSKTFAKITKTQEIVVQNKFSTQLMMVKYSSITLNSKKREDNGYGIPVVVCNPIIGQMLQRKMQVL